MWSKLWTWANGNRILATISVIVLLVAILSAVDGQRMRGVASGYLNLARGWADAYKRDTAASEKAYKVKIEAVTKERDAALARLNAPWKPPKDAPDLVRRLGEHGLKAQVRK